MVLALTGNNYFPIKTRLNELVEGFAREYGDFAVEKLDAEEATYDQILGAVKSLPFLAAKKMVVVKDMSSNKEASDSLQILVEQAGGTTDLVIIESKIDKRSSYYKQLKKLTEFSEFNDPDEQQLVGWLTAEAASRQGVLGRNDARYLVDRVGPSQMKLSRELEKLLQYDKKITQKTIDLLTDENPSTTVFNLIDSVFSGQTDKALKIYDDQRRQRIEPQAIHGMLVWQMHAVAVCATAPKNYTGAQIGTESGLSPFVIQKSQRIAREMGGAKIIEFIDLLSEIDYRGKHEALDYDEALRYAIISLTV